MLLLLQGATALTGFAAAVFWWLSAQRFFTQTRLPGGTKPVGGKDGDKAYDLGDVVIVEHHSRAAWANAWGAVLSGFTVLLQAAPSALAMIGITLQ
ncbi:hypothetical protein [Devosia beringensis]|uniref:hypothetical protein n=1 Tax=Devosia beringensis TaxID=2657486 RepID=UPI00186B6E65|nr:hypothetical protein [Devosia beringensis]